MALKVLPNNVRSILSASAQVNNYKTAVEELVLNSLDAESTSIAIRVHIQDNRIQVIDNGNGISKTDCNALGQRHMTSKLIDLSDLKAIPKYYGYRGEFLANVINISHDVKITSRHVSGEETWTKTFCKGKEKKLTQMTTRPSKGTTVDIKGFLYNLNIQRQTIDAVNELQAIKSFLEQLSLVHNNISLSLRDDSKNEIIFKIHKKRDVYQTLSTLFDIEQTAVQELQVEKNQYKVKALIGKTDIAVGKHWIFINGKFIHNNRCILHKIINEYLKKYLLIRDKRNSKSKINHDEDHLFNQNIPFYFVFITCPYIDYDVSSTSIQSNIDFKNWEQINKILEKLIKFYVGDYNIKKNNKNANKNTVDQPSNNDGSDKQDHIKKIIDKILGSNPKKLRVSQLQNGVKGKMIKRKIKNKFKKAREFSLLSQHNKQLYKYDIDMALDKSTEKKNSDSKNMEERTDKNEPNVKNCCDISEENNVSENSSLSHRRMKKPKQNQTSKIKNDNKTNKKKSIKMSSVKKNSKPTKRNDRNKIKHSKQKTFKYHTIEQYDVLPNFNEAGSVINLTNNERSKGEKDLMFQRDNRAIQDMKLKVNQYKYHNNRAGYTASSNLDEKMIKNYIMHRIKTKPFKTTYDLVETILQSQGDCVLHQDANSLKFSFQKHGYPTLDSGPKSMSIFKRPIKSVLTESITKYKSIDYSPQKKSQFSSVSSNFITSQLSWENKYRTNKYTDLNYKSQCTPDYSLTVEPTYQSLRCEDIFKEKSDIFTLNEPLFLSNTPTLSALTYESHKYNQNIFCTTTNNNDNVRHVNKARHARFITKQSRDNFVITNEQHAKPELKKYFKHRNDRYCNKKTKYYSRHVKQTVDESYTIEFTKSNDNNYSTKACEILSNKSAFPKYYVNNKTQTLNKYRHKSPNCDPSLGFGNTYTIPSYSISSGSNIITQYEECINANELFVTNSHSKNTHINNIDEIIHEKNDINVMFVSKSQCSNNKVLDDDIEPINLCETVFNDNEAIEKEFDGSFNKHNRLDDTFFNDFSNYNDNPKKYATQFLRLGNQNEDVSHHFGNSLTTNHLKAIDSIEANLQESTHEKADNQNKTINLIKVDQCDDSEYTVINHNVSNFNFKERLRFLPKGMSQIFEKCGSKAVCNYNLDEEYYEDIIYNDFANDVHMQAEIYEPMIQNVEDLTTKDIHKFKNRVHKDSACLAFDETSLKGAKVLNQVDCKFIAVIMKEKYRESDIVSEYLVLFDQHAVHERIRLEKNLEGYFTDDRWTSVPIDDVIIKMTKDEIVYLHNYKDKFSQLGLEWTILNKDEVSISSIPEAILGKNPREVDKVIKAVKNLIVEEINVIKMQKGCISMYPKSIMDLVFSEACRYAIKFGDKLSKNECVKLLNDLSHCKTPFQCAHGRPVMAVLLEIKSNVRDYKFDIASLLRFKQSKKLNNVN